MAGKYIAKSSPQPCKKGNKAKMANKDNQVNVYYFGELI